MGVTGGDSFEKAKQGPLRALYDREDDNAIALATAFDTARSRVEEIAGTIAGALPDFTDHSIRHIDALWDFVGYLLGDEAVLNPGEAFVLGGAILLHDLVMTPKAYPQGFPKPGGQTQLDDLIAAELRRRGDRPTSAEDIVGCPEDVCTEATRAYLRRHHAEGARTLATAAFPLADGDLHIIEDDVLRAHYGPLIGTLAASHWWDHDRLEAELGEDPELTAPPQIGGGWPVKPLRMACLLRCADAAHLDNRRASRLRRYLQDPSEASSSHWDFQAKVTGHGVQDGKLVYHAPTGFTVEGAPAWWLGYRTLRDTLDHELRQCHGILVKANVMPFQVVGVHGVESPERFAGIWKTHGWKPVDAEIKVADTKRLIELLGGEQLYGKNPSVALRELVQNARDAVAARRAIQPAMPEGTVTVRIDVDGDTAHIRVTDNGVGMSERTITRRLLVLGGSLWDAEEVIDELPGLARSEFEAVGRFGIGFFSVSMIADAVRVTTQHYKAGVDQTLVVDMGDGFAGTPILRPAKDDELLDQPGTEVRLTLPASRLADLKLPRTGSAFDLSPEWRPDAPDSTVERIRSLVPRMFPMLDCRLRFVVGDETLTIEADAWLDLDAEDLRLLVDQHTWFSHHPIGPVTTIHDDDGNPFGRVTFTTGEAYYDALMLTVGGLAAGVTSAFPLTGLIRATSYDITRNRGTTEIPAQARADLAAAVDRWAEETTDLPEDDRIFVLAVQSFLRDDEPPIFTLADGITSWSEVASTMLDRDEVLFARIPLRHSSLRPSVFRAGGHTLLRKPGGTKERRSIEDIFFSFPLVASRDDVWDAAFAGSTDRSLDILGGPMLSSLVEQATRAALAEGGTIGPVLRILKPPALVDYLSAVIDPTSRLWVEVVGPVAGDLDPEDETAFDRSVTDQLVDDVLASGLLTDDDQVALALELGWLWFWPTRYSLALREEDDGNVREEDVIVVRPRRFVDVMTGRAHPQALGISRVEDEEDEGA